MRRFLVALLFSLPALAFGQFVRAQTPEVPPLAILSPLHGQAIQGTAGISASFAFTNTRSAQLEFTYSGVETETWFLIWESDGALAPGLLVQWDTTTLTDGIYNLRLVIETEDDRQETAWVEGIRIRNYTPIETDTPVPTATHAPGDTPVPSATPPPTLTPLPEPPTPLPRNPASLTSEQVGQSLLWAAIGVSGAFILIGLYAYLRRLTGR